MHFIRDRLVAALLIAPTIATGANKSPTTTARVAARRLEVRVPAFTAYLEPNPAAARVSERARIVPFASPHTRLVWFGQFVKRGRASVSVGVALPVGTRTALRLTVAGAHHDATVSGTGDTETRVSFGTFDIADTGYVRFELATTVGDAAPALETRALIVEGDAVDGAHFNVKARRNAASVHLRYPVDTSALITGFYNEVTAVDDPVATYYMACGFARGYFGMQVNSPTERRIIFSVWDAASGTTAIDRSTVDSSNFTTLRAKGDGVVAEVFGNEGTGGHSHLVYNWKTGSTQRFFVTAEPDGQFTTYSGYWWHPDRKAWMLIASFRAAKDGHGLSRLYSFSENFDGQNGNLRRKALYGSQWVRLADGTWKELTTAAFTHDATGKDDRFDRFMGVEDGRFFLSHGGFVPGFTASGTAFTRPATGTPPNIVLPPASR